MMSWMEFDVTFKDTGAPAGRIAVDDKTGAVRFLAGAPALEEAVRASLSQGPHRLTTIQMGDGCVGTASKRVYPSDPMFEAYLNHALVISGLRLVRAP